MKIFCKIFGHKWIPETNPIGAVHRDFIYYNRKIICQRCGYYYKSCYLTQNFNKEEK